MLSYTDIWKCRRTAVRSDLKDYGVQPLSKDNGLKSPMP
mgnify:CR=1 FL=1